MLEILTRATNFWCYQSNHEMSSYTFLYSAPHVDGSAYQEYLVKSLQDKLNGLNTQLETVIRESNTEINRPPASGVGSDCRSS